MRRKITHREIVRSYQLAKSVFFTEMKKKDAVHLLHSQLGTSIGSASNMISVFRYMMTGKLYTHGLSVKGTTYFLDQILEEFGESAFRKAYEAVMLYTEYHNRNKTNNQSTFNNLLEQYKFLYKVGSKVSPNIVASTSLLSEKEALNLLEKLPPKKQEKIKVNGITYKRDQYAVRLIKIIKGHKCEACGYQLIMENGNPYIEAAHIIPKYKGGEETLENILLLCPNHHKEFDLGNRENIQKIIKQNNSNNSYTPIQKNKLIN